MQDNKEQSKVKQLINQINNKEKIVQNKEQQQGGKQQSVGYQKADKYTNGQEQNFQQREKYLIEIEQKRIKNELDKSVQQQIRYEANRQQQLEQQWQENQKVMQVQQQKEQFEKKQIEYEKQQKYQQEQELIYQQEKEKEMEKEKEKEKQKEQEQEKQKEQEKHKQKKQEQENEQENENEKNKQKQKQITKEVQELEYTNWKNSQVSNKDLQQTEIEVDEQEIFYLLQQPQSQNYQQEQKQQESQQEQQQEQKLQQPTNLVKQQQYQVQQQIKFFEALKNKQNTKVVLNLNQPKQLQLQDYFKNVVKIAEKEKPFFKYQFETQFNELLLKWQQSNQIVNPLSLVINQKIEADNPEVLFYVLGDQMRRQNKVFFKSLQPDEKLIYSFQGLFTAESQDSQSFSLKLQETPNLSYNTIATDQQKRDEFLKTFKQCLSIDLKVPEDQIQIVGLEQGSIDVIFEIVKVNENAAKEEVIKTVTYDTSDSVPTFDELQKKFGSQCKPRLNIHDYFQKAGLSPDDFEPRYNMEWGSNTFGNYDKNGRGPRGNTQPYFFPVGWKGYALKVAGKYDNGNDDWLMMNNNPEEWYVMFHGTKQQFCKGIKENGLKGGGGQYYSEDICIRTGEKIGTGVYFSNHIEVPEQGYTHDTPIGDKQFKVAFQTRVRPSALRQCPKKSDISNMISDFKLNNLSYDPSLNDMTLWDNDYFVVNKTEDIRPYRILLKEVKCRK